jgi:K+-sensing histidine kinase KdpD
MSAEQTSSASQPSQRSQDQIDSLKQDLEKARATNQALWRLLDEMSNRMQISLAGIKASVTSLLDYDILWDGKTRHDFLEIIENNVDAVSKKIMLFTVASKIQTDQLELVLEPNSIEEVLSYVVDLLAEGHPSCTMKIDYAADGKPILVDFEYFSRALLLLLETFVEIHPERQPCQVKVGRKEAEWFIQIPGLDPVFKEAFIDLPSGFNEPRSIQSWISSLNQLRLYVIKQLLTLQNVKLDVKAAEEEQTLLLYITIPAAKGI